ERSTRQCSDEATPAGAGTGEPGAGVRRPSASSLNTEMVACERLVTNTSLPEGSTTISSGRKTPPNGEPGTAESVPLAAIRSTDTLLELAFAASTKRPSGSTVIPSMRSPPVGAGDPSTCKGTPSSRSRKLEMVLLAAFPTKREFPLTAVSDGPCPSARYGDPGRGPRTPLRVSNLRTEKLLLASLATKRRLREGSAENDSTSSSFPPEGNGEPGRGVRPPTSSSR